MYSTKMSRFQQRIWSTLEPDWEEPIKLLFAAEGSFDGVCSNQKYSVEDAQEKTSRVHHLQIYTHIYIYIEKRAEHDWLFDVLI